MTVYRVENELGKGMYRGNYCDGLLMSIFDPMRHPMPSEDSRLMREIRHAGLLVMEKNMYADELYVREG